MKTTLLVEKNTELEDFYSINLHTWVGCKVIAFTEAKFAIEYLQNNTDIDLVVSRSKINTERSAEAIYDYIKDTPGAPKLVVLGGSQIANENITHLPTGLDAKGLVKACAHELGVTAKDMAQKVVPHYFPIPAKLFILLEQSICDIYSFDEETQSYDIYFEKDKAFSDSAIRMLREQIFETLYLKKEDRLNFVNNYNREVAAKLDHKTLNNDEQIKASELSHELLQQKISKLGINKDTIQLAQKNLVDMGKTAKKTPSLMRLLKRLIANKTGYLFKHSQILMFVSAHLMENLDWGTAEQTSKLKFIAFFHDIALEDSIQAQIHSEDDLRNSDLPANKKELVKKHAQLSAALVNQYPNAPLGVETIIKQHHGVANGLGFSEHFSQNISPMAIVFILAEDFVDEILKTQTQFDIQSKINQMRERFTTQRFQKIIDVLETVVL